MQILEEFDWLKEIFIVGTKYGQWILVKVFCVNIYGEDEDLVLDELLVVPLSSTKNN